MKKKKRARLYGRFSSTNQKEESIEQQFEACREYAEREGYVITGEYADKALTGKNAERRKQFMKMLRDAEKGLFDVLLVWKLDRFARNRDESAVYRGMLKRAGVKLISVMEQIPEGAEGILLESVLEGYAEYFSANLAENVRRGLNDAAKAAKFTGGHMPFGYKTDADGHFLIDEARAPIVREVFERYAKGEPQKAIVDSLNARGLVTPKGKKFTRGSVVSILQNEKYIGVYKYRMDDEETIVIEGGCPAIVSREVWALAQSRKKPDGKNRRLRIYPLSALTHCACCDAPYHGVCGTRSNGTHYRYYRHRTATDEDFTCRGRKYIGMDFLENAAIDAIRATVLNMDMITEIIAKAMELQAEDKNDDTALLESELEQVKIALHNLFKAIEAGMFSESIQARFQELEQRRSILEEELAQKTADQERKLSAEDIESFLLAFMEGDFEDEDFRKELMRQFVRKIVIDEEYATIYLNYAPNGEGQKLLLLGNSAKAKLHIPAHEKGLAMMVKLPALSGFRVKPPVTRDARQQACEACH